MLKRCPWAENSPLEKEYHDNEWGIPVHDDNKLFEFLILELMQAGLSWLTILKKRPALQKAFTNWDYHKIAKYDADKFTELINNKAIIRNKLKINAAIHNAKQFILIQKKFGSFNEYIWHFTAGKTITNGWHTPEEVPASTPLSEQISKDLKKHDFKFIGPTIIYSFLQAVGIVNDHLCSCYKKNNCCPK